jgi:hypothetical protein
MTKLYQKVHSVTLFYRVFLGIRFTNAISCFEPGLQEPNWDIATPCTVNCMFTRINT